MKALAIYSNVQDGMTAQVVAGDKGGFNVTLRDADSGLYVAAFCGFKTQADAEAKAMQVVMGWAQVSLQEEPR